MLCADVAGLEGVPGAVRILELLHEPVLLEGNACSWYPPPLVVPHPLSFPNGGVGDRHLVNPKFFVAVHCVVVWVTVLWGTTTCIPCTHGGTFCLLSLKWFLIAQPCFPLGPDKCDG